METKLLPICSRARQGLRSSDAEERCDVGDDDAAGDVYGDDERGARFECEVGPVRWGGVVLDRWGPCRGCSRGTVRRGGRCTAVVLRGGGKI
jgi:hypothetical protein